jgi:arginase family enzyme
MEGGQTCLVALVPDSDRLRRAGRVEAAGYSAERDPVTKVMNPQALSDYSPLLADAVAAVLDEGEFPVVLGGDCSILLGTMLALRRRGRYGLLYIDGDADSYQPEVKSARRRGVGQRSGVRNRTRPRRGGRHRGPAAPGAR